MGLPDIISDEEMTALENQANRGNSGGGGGSSLDFSAGLPDIISDAQMLALERQGGSNNLFSFAPGVNELTGGDDTSSLQRAARVGVGGLSQFLPFGDEIVAGGSAVVDKLKGGDLTDSYKKRLNEVRDYQEAFNKQSSKFGGIATPAVQLGGALALPAPGLAKLTTSLPGKIGLTALEGGGIGALYGADAAEGGLAERAKGAAEGATSGALWSTAIGTPLLAAEKYLPALNKIGKATQRSALGATASDYKKGLVQAGIWDIVDDAVESKTATALNDIIDSGQLGPGRDGQKVLATVFDKQKEIGDKIGGVIRAANTGKIQPKFDQTLSLLESGKIPADEVERYLSDVLSLEAGIKNHGKGSLEFLQQQKIAIGNKYKFGETISNLFNRSLYHDIQKTIEEAAPEVIPLNRELAKWKILEPIARRTAGLDEAANPIKGLRQALRTSGGVLTTPTLIGSAVGATSGGPLGLLAGAALGAASTGTGKNAVGSGLRTLSKSSSIFGAAGEKAPSIFGRLAAPSDSPDSYSYKGTPDAPSQTGSEELLPTGAQSPLLSEQALSSSGQSTTNKKIARQQPSEKANQTPSNTPDDVFINKLLDAVRQVESGGNDKAISKAGAKGPYQFTDATAKDYGLEDPFDPESSRQAAASKILDDWEKFGDLRLALAAYNAGAGRIGKLLDRVDGESYDDISHLLPKETQAYVPKIEKVFEKLMRG